MPVPKAMVRRPAGRIIAEYLYEEEARAIIRAHLATEQTTRTALAREIGITINDFRAFMNGAALFEPAYTKVNRWCVRRPTPFVQAETVGLAILSRWAGRSKIRSLRQAIAGAVLRVYDDHRVRLPTYVVNALEADSDD